MINTFKEALYDVLSFCGKTLIALISIGICTLVAGPVGTIFGIFYILQIYDD